MKSKNSQKYAYPVYIPYLDFIKAIMGKLLPEAKIKVTGYYTTHFKAISWINKSKFHK